MADVREQIRPCSSGGLKAGAEIGQSNYSQRASESPDPGFHPSASRFCVTQAFDADTEEVAAQDEQDPTNDVEPLAVEQRTGDHEPDTGEDEQQTAENADPSE